MIVSVQELSMFCVRGRVGEYELVRILDRSRGTAGMVYLGVDLESRRRVAVKVIPRFGGTAIARAVAAERQGARLQEQLAERTDLVPEILGYGDDGSLFFVAMQYVEGDDLDKKAGSGLRLRPDCAAAIARDICECLAIAHTDAFVIDARSCAIVHGDIKPENIRVTRTGHAKLLDFGNATPIGRPCAGAHNNCLTAEYASPERLLTNVVDFRSDLWAVGVVLYESLVGRRPWENTGRDRMQLLRGTRPPVRLPWSCPPVLERIVLKALAPRVEDRYQTASDMRDDLEAFLDTTPGCGERMEELRRAAVPANR